MNNKTTWIEREIENLKIQGLYKHVRTLESPSGPEIIVDGKKVLNFCSNNYLGFTNNPVLKKAAIRAIEKYGVGTGAVRTIAGTMVLHLELEKKLAEFKKAEDVIVFQSGLMANIAVIPALMGEGDVIFSDELNHASIIDGCRLSKAIVVRYPHNNLVELEKLVKQNAKVAKKLIVTDGVFSMDGDISNLPGIVKIADKYDCLTMVDDAHGEGVLGKSGRGIVDHYNLHGQFDIEVGTLSKAFGVVGGFVAGKKIIIDWLRQKARPFLFSTSLSPADIASCIAAVDILEKSDLLVKKMWANARYFKDKMKKLGFNVGHSVTPIVPVMLMDEKVAVEFSKKLFAKGIFAVALCYPTVPLGKARIRVMISAAHTKKHLDQALSAFAQVKKEQ